MVWQPFESPIKSKPASILPGSVNRGLMAALIYIGVLYLCIVWLCFMIIHCSPWYLTPWSHRQVTTALWEPTSPVCNRAPDKALRKWRFNFNVHHAIHWPQRWDWRLWKHTASEALPRSRLPGNCCYATVESPNQSAACCSLRLNCTTMFQILVRSAVYTQTIDSTQESREMHVNASASPTSGFCSKKKKKKETWISQNDASH